MKEVYGNSATVLNIASESLNVFLINNEGYLSIASINSAFNKSFQGNWLGTFLTYLSAQLTVPIDTVHSVTNPYIFNYKENNVEHTELAVHANIFLSALIYIKKAGEQGFLYASEMRYAEKAQNILEFDYEHGLEKVIRYASGADLFKLNHKIALIRYLQPQIKKPYLIWIKTLPDAFIDVILKLQSQQWADLNLRPEQISAEILSILFARLKPNLLSELSTSKPRKRYGNHYRLTEFLPHPELAAHLQTIMNIAELSDYNTTIFNQLLDKVLPIQTPAVIKALKKKENPITPELTDLAEIVKMALPQTTSSSEAKT